MTPDEERWAEAGQILKWKGDEAQAFVSDRLAALEATHDTEGVERFRAIEIKLKALIHAAQA